MMKQALLLVSITLMWSVCCCSAVLRVPSEYETIQSAIEASLESDTVLVAAGTYIGTGNKNIDFMGKKITLLSETSTDQTIIDCENEGRGFHFQCGEDSLSILDGFTIMNGYVTGSWPDGSGGGILCNNSSPTILNCILTENNADGTAGIYCENTQTQIINCKLYENIGVGTGGISGSTIILDCEIFNNIGCGIRGALNVKDCFVFDNYNPDHYGGGIFCVSEVTNCIVSGNSGKIGGGICWSDLVKNCIITGNTAVTNGGGLEDCRTIEDCIIAGNSRSGVYSTGHTIIINSTIVGNSRGGVKCISSYGYATIVNCIFWDNGGLEIDDWNGWSEVDYSTVQGAIWPGDGNIMSNPRFVDPRNGDFRLLPESPCIDAGDPSYTPRPGGGRRIDMGAIEHFLGFNFAKGAMSQTRRVPQDYPTIQEAIDVAVYLDTILVADGTYTGEGNKNIEFLGKTIIVQSENGPETTIIDCENDGRGFYFQDYETPEAKLKGFAVVNGFEYDGGGINCDNSSPSILNCWITNCETPRDGGGVFCSSDAVIADCLIADNKAGDDGGGLEFVDRYGEYFFQVYNSIFVSNEASDKGGGIYGGSPSSITNCTVYGNTANQGYGLACDSGFLTVSNSIFRDDQTSEIFFYEYEEPVITFSNILGGWEGEGNIDADPLFVDPENGDFHLTVDSPCIDAGTLEGSPEFDFEGDPRPQGDGVDMGADEYSDAVTRVFIQKQQIPTLNDYPRKIQPKNKWIIK